MAQGTVTRIQSDGLRLLVEVDIDGALYVVLVSRAEFDALPSNPDKQAYIIEAIANARRTDRQLENDFPAFIGAVVTIPD